jgi:hypothetical protein
MFKGGFRHALCMLAIGAALVEDNAAWAQQCFDWTGALPSYRYGPAMAYDSAREVAVLFGGARGVGAETATSETWEWDGERWHLRTTLGPSPRALTAMAYDSARGVVVMFGGAAQDPIFNNWWLETGDTWEWDGKAWTLRATTGPAPGWLHSMAYDPIRRVTVLVGGGPGTWEWDGQTWVQRTAVSMSTLFYDVYRDRMIAFNGSQGSTWEFEPVTGVWLQLPVSSPTPREGQCMAYDTDRAMGLLYGGFTPATGSLRDTWEWRSAEGKWVLVDHGGNSGGNEAAMTYDADRHKMLRFGGIGALPDLMAFDQVQSQWQIEFASPLFEAVSIAYDTKRGVLVMLGMGSNTTTATWEWDGTSWVLRNLGGLAPRHHARMVYDSQRHVCVLFGGDLLLTGGANASAETWEWDGRTWTLVANGGPSPRWGHVMAFDSVQGVTVVFGGLADASYSDPHFGDTWTWDGKVWQQVAFTGPAPRREAAMAFDSSRGVAVLFGGSLQGSVAPLRDTWEWNGGAWTQRNPSMKPASAGPMAFDRRQGVIECFSDGMWQWNGQQWTRRLASLPAPFLLSGIAYDTTRNVMALVSDDHSWVLQGHWELAVAQCQGDVNLDGVVDVDDLIAVILAWGPCPAPPSPCAADLTGDGQVNIDDLIAVILNWGA